MILSHHYVSGLSAVFVQLLRLSFAVSSIYFLTASLLLFFSLIFSSLDSFLCSLFLPLLSIIFFPLLGYRWASRPYDSFFFFLISPFVSHPPYQHVQLTVLLTCIITNLSISFTSFSPHRGRVSVPLFIFHPFASFKYKEHVFFCLSLFFSPIIALSSRSLTVSLFFIAYN